MGKYEGCDTGLPLLKVRVTEVTMDGLFEEMRQQEKRLDLRQEDEFDELNEIAGDYLEHGINGIIAYFQKANGDKEKAIEFSKKLRVFCHKNNIYFRPAISPKVKSLIADAQIERQKNGNKGPIFKLGEAIFGDRWSRLLNTTV